ncbi:MAG: hypothetical protein JNM39_04370 [Bdellovibrionaceae bacterium]|nr:hypothetical protein [Pseudobdellovibrionaceae bacterium]
MRNLMFTASLLLSTSAFAGDHDPARIAGLMNTAKMSLAEGIEYAEKTSGVATSAKFEIADDGKLELSVYTIPEGLNVEAEKSQLTELSGHASEDLGKLKATVFADKEHIARSSVHLTLRQLSKMSLKQIVEKAEKVASGQAIDVRNPIVRNSKPVADVVVVGKNQKISTVTIDLLSGQASKKL